MYNGLIVRQLITQIRHDFILEYRSWHQTLALVLFMWTLAYVIYRVRPEISPQEFNFIYWIFLLIIAINVAVRSDSHSGAAQRLMTYTLLPPETMLLARIVFNIVYLIIIAGTFYGAMLLLFYPQITFSSSYFLLSVFGAASVGSVLAFISALTSHMGSQNTAMSILSIPILIPVIILLNSIGGHILMSNQLQGGKYVAVLGITLLSVALSMILFPYIWRE